MSAIRKNYTLADVICQHKTDGTIIPLKIRIAGEDGEYQIFKIKSYKVLSDHKEHTLPNGVSATLSNHLWQFECKICVFNMIKQFISSTTHMKTYGKFQFLNILLFFHRFSLPKDIYCSTSCKQYPCRHWNNRHHSTSLWRLWDIWNRFILYGNLLHITGIFNRYLYRLSKTIA